MEIRLSEIAARLSASVEGGDDVVIRGVAGVRAAAADELAFVSQARYAHDAARSGAGALLVGLDWTTPFAQADAAGVDARADGPAAPDGARPPDVAPGGCASFCRGSTPFCCGGQCRSACCARSSA